MTTEVIAISVVELRRAVQELKDVASKAESASRKYEEDGVNTGPELDELAGIVSRHLCSSAALTLFETGEPPVIEYVYYHPKTLRTINDYGYPFAQEVQKCLADMWPYGEVAVAKIEIDPKAPLPEIGTDEGVVAQFSVET